MEPLLQSPVTEEVTTAATARARGLVDLGRAGEALPLLRDALAHAPHDPRLLDLLAQAEVAVDPAAGRATAAALAAATPESHRGYLLGSVAALGCDDQRDAERLARLAVARGPHVGMCHAVLAQALAGRRRFRKARAAARRAIVLDPGSSTTHVVAGCVELAGRRKRKARRLFERALELDPADPDAQKNLAIANGALGEVTTAPEILQSLLALDPRDADARRLFDRVIGATIADLQWVVLGASVILLAVHS